MRVRHKIPSIFSLSMVDMLCCALGCVILVWLLNAKQSDEEADERRQEIDTLMSRAQSDREESQRLLTEAQGQHARATASVRDLTRERDRWMAESAKLTERLQGLERTRTSLTKQLTGEQERARELTGQMEAAGKRVASLEGDVESGSKRLEAERKKVAGLAKQVGEKEETLKGANLALGKQEKLVSGLQAELKLAQQRHQTERDRADGLTKRIEAVGRDLTQTEGMLRDTRQAKEKADKTLTARDLSLVEAGKREKGLERQLSERQASLDEALARLARMEKDSRTALETVTAKATRLENEKRVLATAADARFAGIELTGKRVLFLVDCSGSMEMLDDKTEAPKKWVEVRNTIGRLMRSLPGLEKYQLLTFSVKSEFPLGSEGRWLDFDTKTSPEEAMKALAAIKPRGGTNMYSALESAFRYRREGMDTIYLLSDGLPNQGDGLTSEQSRTLSGIDRGVALGQHVRKTLRTTWNHTLTGQPRVKIHTIGFFFESPDLGSFLWALARENEGSFVGMSRP